MSSFLANTSIGVMQKAFYQFSTTNGSGGNYIHLKTNIVSKIVFCNEKLQIHG